MAQRRFGSEPMEFVPQAAMPMESDGSEDNNDNPGSSRDVEMRDSSQDPSLDNSSTFTGGSPSNLDPPIPFMSANPLDPSARYHIDNRVYTTNIRSGNVNTEHTSDSFNDNSTHTEVHKQTGMFVS